MANKKKLKKVKPAVKSKTKVKPKIKAKPKTKVVKKTTVKAKPKPKTKTKVQIKAKVKAPVKKVAAPVKSQPKIKIDYSKAITPLGERLVVRLVTAERVTAGGLIIPESVNQATGFLKATVLAIGTGTKNKKGQLKPMDVQVGDTVLFSQHSGTKVQFNSEDLQIIKESDVMGIVQN